MRKVLFLKKGLLAGAALSLTFAIGLRPAGADTLADALVGAYTHSGLLDQNRALLRAADEDVATAAAALKPIVSWAGEVRRNFGNQRSRSLVGFNTNSLSSTTAEINLIAELLLWDAGAASLNVQAAKETVLATRENLLSIEQQVLLRAISAFMTVREATEFVTLRNNNLRLLTQELKAAKDRFEVGEVTRTDVALAEAQLAQARSGLATAQGNLLRAQEEYRNVVGRKPGRLSAPPKLPNVGNSVKKSKGLAVRNHPDMRAAQHQVAAAELNILRAEAAMSPTVSLTGRLGVRETFSSESYTRSGSVAVEASGPIYQGGRLSSQARRAMASRDAQRANLHVVRHNLQQGVGDAFAQLSATRASLEASERQIRAARIAFRGVREEATLGARTTLDVLDAEQSLLDAEAARISAQADLYVAAYTVLSATGRLTAKELRLPVQIYDPSAYYNLVKDAPAKRSKEGEKLDRVLRALQKD